METRSDWHGVYIDLNVFAEYAANNPSSAYDLYLGIWKRQRLRGSASQVVVRSTYGRLSVETLHSSPPRAWLPFGSHR
jgi:hypothetical protein